MHMTAVSKASPGMATYLVPDQLGPLSEAQGAECLLQANCSRADIGYHDSLGVAPQRILPHTGRVGTVCCNTGYVDEQTPLH